MPTGRFAASHRCRVPHPVVILSEGRRGDRVEGPAVRVLPLGWETTNPCGGNQVVGVLGTPCRSRRSLSKAGWYASWSFQLLKSGVKYSRISRAKSLPVSARGRKRGV